jgi:hypothetical protein
MAGETMQASAQETDWFGSSLKVKLFPEQQKSYFEVGEKYTQLAYLGSMYISYVLCSKWLILLPWKFLIITMEFSK